MKKFFIGYYKYRLNKLVEAQLDSVRYWCVHSQRNSIIDKATDLNIAWQEFLLELYKSLIPKKWIVK